jgi:hypothetical protein
MNKPTSINIKADREVLPEHFQMWQAISSAPFDRNLELAVIEHDSLHALVFPCRRVFHGWVSAATNQPVRVHPTHWRPWNGSVSPLFSRTAP